MTNHTSNYQEHKPKVGLCWKVRLITRWQSTTDIRYYRFVLLKIRNVASFYLPLRAFYKNVSFPRLLPEYLHWFLPDFSGNYFSIFTGILLLIAPGILQNSYCFFFFWHFSRTSFRNFSCDFFTDSSQDSFRDIFRNSTRYFAQDWFTDFYRVILSDYPSSGVLGVFLMEVSGFLLGFLLDFIKDLFHDTTLNFLFFYFSPDSFRQFGHFFRDFPGILPVFWQEFLPRFI